MQTSVVHDKQISECLKAGVFYYVTKPYSSDTLLAIVTSSIKDKERKRNIENKIIQVEDSVELMETDSFLISHSSRIKKPYFSLTQPLPKPRKSLL